MKQLFNLEPENQGKKEVIQALSEISNIPIEKIDDNTKLITLAKKANLTIDELLEHVVVLTKKKIGNPESSVGFLSVGNIGIRG